MRVTRPGKVASGVNVSGGHIQGAPVFFGLGAEIQRVIHERAPKMKRQTETDLQGKTTLPCASVQRIWARRMSTFGNNLFERLRVRLVDVSTSKPLG